MTDAAPEEFEGRPVMGRRVVLVPQSTDGIPHSPFNFSNSVEADEVPESVVWQAPVQFVMGSEVAGRFPVAELESGHQSGPPFCTGRNQSRTSDTESVVVEESEIVGDDSRTSPEGEDLVMSQPRGAHITAAFISLEAVDISSIFCTRASVMKSVPKFLKGLSRIA